MMSIVFALVFVVLSMAPLVILRAWAISWLWLWFVVPLGAPPIGIAWSIGLSSLGGLFQHSPNDNGMDKENPLSSLSKLYSKVIILPLLALLIGWIAHYYMIAA